MRCGICLLFNINIDADSVDLDQTALKEQSDLHLDCLFTRLQKFSAILYISALSLCIFCYIFKGVSIKLFLSHDVASGSDITSCIKLISNLWFAYYVGNDDHNDVV